jgi:FixJ family two-component response regulator
MISIVDDDASIRAATKRLMLLLGYESEAFASAEEFLGSGRLGDTSCVISDVQMPGMSGIEMRDQLIANGYRTPVIFVTAFPDDSVRARVLHGGAAGYLSKPLDEKQLIGCLDEALERDRPAPGQ